MNDNRLIIFVKAPRPGSVKTRLAASLGAGAACAAYRRLVESLLERLDGIEGVELRFAPDDAASEIRPWLRPGWRMTRQGTGDLGEKLSRAARETFSVEAQRLVVIGSDCPQVTRADIEAAWAALADHDVVLGPATDGGYWLVGLRSADTRVFDGIAWSTNAVLEQTLARCRDAGLTVKLLRELSDVDTPQDWQRFLAAQERCAEF